MLLGSVIVTVSLKSNSHHCCHIVNRFSAKQNNGIFHLGPFARSHKSDVEVESDLLLTNVDTQVVLYMDVDERTMKMQEATAIVRMRL